MKLLDTTVAVDHLRGATPAVELLRQDVARTAGALARAHPKTHGGIDDADYLIAATAIVLDAELLTTNVRHFPMLTGLRAPY